MNLVELLKFIPLVIGGVLAYHLIFKLQLPSKNIGAILTYFIGIIIVFLAVSWLITSFLADWANDLLTAGTDGTEWTQFIDDSEDVFDGAFVDSGSGNSTTTVPTVVQVNNTVIITATPFPGVSAGQSSTEGVAGTTTYTVVSGDTLHNISTRFGVTVDQIRQANGIPSTSALIVVGQKLTIPAK